MLSITQKVKKIFRPDPPNFYKLLGEEAGLTELVNAFYSNMQKYDAFKNVLNSHQRGIDDEIKKKLVYFLSGWLGGPNLFIETYGHPRMKARHGHVKIGESERNEWLMCMQLSLDEHSSKLKKKYKHQLMDSFTALAVRIQNQN
jgi:hemoglobin